jgi:dihydroflavonol-4-reductase
VIGQVKISNLKNSLKKILKCFYFLTKDAEKSYPYPKSKILAEKAAWDFVAEKKKNNEKVFDLAVINPSIIYGPTLGGSLGLGTSELTIAKLFDGNSNKLSQFFCGHCDVRDVALAHLRAAFLPEAVGHRHIIVSEGKWFSIKRAADILSNEFGPKGFKVNTDVEPKDDPNNYSDNTRMVKVLGITPTG